MKTIIILCFLISPFVIFSYKKNDTNVSHIINAWGYENKNYNPNIPSIVIGNSLKNCVTCINPAINKIIDNIKRSKINFNIFVVFETDAKKESLNYRKYYKNCLFAEDYNGILINNFGLEEFPSLFLISPEGKIVYKSDSINKNIDEITKFIKDYSSLSIKLSLTYISSLEEDDDYLIHNIKQLSFNKEKNTLILFESGFDAIIEYDISSGKYLNRYLLTDTIYKHFVDTIHQNLWENLINQSPRIVDYICMINGFDSPTFLTKVVSGFRKMVLDPKHSNDSIFVTKISYCIVSIEQNNDYIIKLILPSQPYFYYENIINSYYVNDKIIFPTINKQIAWGGKPYFKNLDSIFFIVTVDYPDNNLEYNYFLKSIDSNITQFKPVDYFFSMNNSELFYFDVNNSICFTSDINRKSIINKNLNITLRDYNLEDAVYDEYIFFLYHIDTDTTFIIQIYDFQLNLKHQIFVSQPLNDILSTNIIGFIDKKLFLLIKSKIKRWKIYILDLSSYF